MVTMIENSWTRSPNGWVAGVCQGVADKLDVPVGMVRLLWIASLLLVGTGFVFYFICAFCLPMRGREMQAMAPKFLGVCSRMSKRFDLDVGLLRVVVVLLVLGSAGTSLLAYLVAHVLLSSSSSDKYSS